MVTGRYELFNRKLSAIVYADVHGYSRLMDQDEAGTVVRLTRSLSFIRGLVGDYGGSVVDTAGDAVVALFPRPGTVQRDGVVRRPGSHYLPCRHHRRRHDRKRR